MPLYTFKCENCGSIFDRVTRIDDRNKPLSEPCENCETEGQIFRVYEGTPFVDPGILKADRNMERSGVQKRLEEIRDWVNPKMKWKG